MGESKAKLKRGIGNPGECYPYVINALTVMNIKSVLQIGCGEGDFIALLMNEKPGIQVYGMNNDRAELDIAKAILPKRVELLQGNEDQIPYPENSFDVVLSIDAFQYYENPIKVLAEIYRVLGPRGKVVIADGWASKAVRKATSILGYFNRESGSAVYEAEEIKEIIRSVGFEYAMWNEAGKGSYIATGQKGR